MSSSDDNPSAEISGQSDEGQVIISPEDDVEFQNLEENSVEIKNQSSFVSQREIIAILFSKKTLYHVLVLFFLLTFFGIVSYTKSDLGRVFLSKDHILNLIWLSH